MIMKFWLTGRNQVQPQNKSVKFSQTKKIKTSKPFQICICCSEAEQPTHLCGNMPTEQTRKALQIISTGIAKIRNPYDPDYLPPGCQRAYASSLLDPSSYATGDPLGGLIYTTNNLPITIDASSMNGLYYDEIGETSPILYLDICIYNEYSQTYTGTVSVKINGALYSGKTVTVTPGYNYIGFTVFTGPPPVKGHGPLITIEYNLPPGLKLYVDAAIEYKYAPEVWRENSYATWALNRVAWLKILLYEYTGASIAWESGIAADAEAFIAGSSTLKSVVFKHRISLEEGSAMGKVVSAGVKAKPPASLQYWPSCTIRHGSGFSPETYIGAAATVWGLVSTGIEVASLVGIAIPEPVSKGAVIANLAFTVLRSSTESSTVYYDNGYYGCSWSAGLSSYEWVEVDLLLPLNSPSVDGAFKLSVMANDGWILRDQSVEIPIYDWSIIQPSINERYYAFYNRAPNEVIHD